MQKEKVNTTSKKRKIIKIIALVTAFIATFTCGYFFYHFINIGSTTLVGSVVNLINNTAYLIDPATGEQRYLTEEEIADLIVDAYMDRYSEYYTKEEYEQRMSESQGNASGFGLNFYANSNKIYKVTGNSPAAKAGIKKDDRLLSYKYGEVVRSVQTNGLGLEGLAAIEGQETTFVILRGEQTLEFKIEKTEYTVTYIEYYDSQVKYYFQSDGGDKEPKAITDTNAGMIELDQKTAYIKFDLFEGDSARQMKDALEFMVERGRENLILDMRNNGGGNLNVLTEIASLFIDNQGKRDNVVAYAKTRNGEEKYQTSGNGFVKGLKKVSIIANMNTASASECLIGALLHYGDVLTMDRVVIEKNGAGEAKTYGKGIMQTTFWLAKGGALKITTGKMFWPDNQTSIHQVGIIALDKNAVEREDAISRAQSCFYE